MKVVSLDNFFKACFKDGGLKLKPLMSQEMLVFFFLDSPETLIKHNECISKTTGTLLRNCKAPIFP